MKKSEQEIKELVEKYSKSVDSVELFQAELEYLVALAERQGIDEVLSGLEEKR